jgi:hypothetical protein
MTKYLPPEQGVVDMIQDAILDLLTRKLQHEVDENDASRLTTIKIGPRQDDPTAVVVLIHEQDYQDPSQWPHRPLRFYGANSRGGRQFNAPDPLDQTPMLTSGYELVGGGSRMARCFTIELEIWGDEIADLNLERRDVGQLLSVVEGRILKTLNEAGPRIGTGNIVSDNFGESVLLGPRWGKDMTDQPEGEALIARKRIRLYYVTTRDWDVTDW